MEVFPLIESLQYGSSWSGVISTLVVFEDGGVLGSVKFDKGYHLTVKGLSGVDVPSTFVILDAKITQVKPMVICEVGESSSYFPVGPAKSNQIMRVVELCSGIGVFSHMATHVGLEPAIGVDMNNRWANLFTSLHDCEFLVGECGDPRIIRSLLAKGLQGCVILAGISCQPHSRAGDRLGMEDPRSRSLPQVLKDAWLMQTPLLILECVPEIQADKEVQRIIADFARKLQLHVTQQVLRLSDSWCTRRDRWFAIFTPCCMHPLSIPQMPVQEQFRLIGQVLPRVLEVNDQEIKQLQLSLYELSKFHDFAAGGISKLMIDFHGVLPTCLHSAGNQLYPCRCGCHQGLSLKRLQEKGLFGTLIGLGESVFHNGINMEQCRYLHPQEMFLLHGGLPHKWGSDLKLALAGIGQCVAPLQGLWVLLHVKRFLHEVFQLPVFIPEECFQRYVDTVLASRQQFVPPERPLPIRQSGEQNDVEMEWYDFEACATSHARVGGNATFKNLKSAESKLTHHMCGVIPHAGIFPEPAFFDQDGVEIAEEKLIGSVSNFTSGHCQSRVELSEVLECPCSEWPNVVEAVAGEVQGQQEVSPTISFVAVEDSVTSFAGLRNRAFLEMSCPKAKNIGEVNELLSQRLTKEDRIELIQRQGDLWADDEIRMHLECIAAAGPKDQNIVVWDPLVVTSVIMHGHLESIDELVALLPTAATIVTAVIIEKHWYPILWRIEPAQAWAFTCGHAWGFSVAINRLHQKVCRARNHSLTAVRFHSLAFRVETCCGAMAIQYLCHLISGQDLPCSLNQLQEKHRAFRTMLIGFLTSSLPRPWIWGLGEGAWFDSLQELLIEHGVKPSESEDRARLVIGKLSETQVVKALKSQSPWKELKWCASQCVPMFQIIRPAELQDVIDAKVKSGQPVGSRGQKKSQKGKGKGKGSAPSSIKVVDPKSLRIESGLFQCGPDIALSQITMQHVGPQASGIVLCTREEADPFLKTGRLTSTGGLALVIVDHISSPPTTPLLAERVRFPALCLANSEPILVDGLMYQLGAQSVVRKLAQPKFELVSVPTCVVKFMLFRDQVPTAWDVVSAHPLKFLFSKIPMLQSCKHDACDKKCPAWHPNDDADLQEPILEVWGRQWMMQNFQLVKADQAEVYAVHLRLPSRIEHDLQKFSGVDGIFLEPKEVDGKKASSSYQVFWQPKATLQEIVHLKQITAHAVGLARMGGKYGIRCHTSHAETVHSSIRPGGSYLPQGKKAWYLIGPMPFGTLKSSVTQIIDMLSWAARPVHPVAAASHIEGVMWKLQAVDPPPQAFVLTDHGELLITRIDEPIHPKQQTSSLLGASHTVSLVTTPVSGAIDPLQIHDPWEQKITNGHIPVTNPIHASDPVDILEKKVTDTVLAKLAASSMEVDSEPSSSAKVATLEQKVQELQASQSKLHSMVCEQSNRQQAQIGALQIQSDRLEASVVESVSQIESFQVQFQGQIEKQQGQLDSLFQQQMDRIESLFQKKARTS